MMVCGAFSLAAQTEPTHLTNQHIDLLVRYAPESETRLELSVRDSSAQRTYATNEVIIHSAESARLILPPGLPFGDEGDPLWVLPQSQDPLLPYLGFSTDGLPLGVYDGPVRYQVLAVDGPGDLFVWQAGLTGFNIRIDTRDGIGPADHVALLAGGHAHYNWGFTAPGKYCVTLQITGRRIGSATDDLSLETPITFYIEPIPLEPHFQVWQRTYWPTCVPDTVQGPDADPDGDGIVNALEYGLGLDPLTPSPDGLPEFQWAKDGEQTYGALRFTRLKAATDLEFLPQAASALDAIEWTPLTQVMEVVDLGETELVVVRDALSTRASGPRFYQLQIRFR